MAVPTIRSSALLRTSLLCAGVLSACAENAGSARPVHPERLDGVWIAQFRETYSPRLPTEPGLPKVIQGRVMLVPNAEGRRVTGFAGVPTHFGTYTTDLDSVGLPEGAFVPTLALRLGEADSVQIAFDPREPRPVVGSGVMRGDSIAGTWHTRGGRNVGDSGGTFTLRRPSQGPRVPGRSAS
jgi:hypothetical protein